MIEEKTRMDQLIKESPLDKVKLKEYAIRSSLPAAHRFLVWKVLLGKFKNLWFQFFVLRVYCTLALKCTN